MSRSRISSVPLLVSALLAAASPRLPAQEPPTGGADELFTLGTEAEDRLRRLQLRGQADAGGFLIRSPSSLTPAPAGAPDRGPRWAPLAPRLTTVWNSDIPFSMNDGGMWAGRGLNLQLAAGAQIAFGPIRLILAPELSYSQNQEFAGVLPAALLDSATALIPPWHTGKHSADLPYRFGVDPLTSLGWGQTTLEVAARGVSAGVSTENQWWGPGIRNAIVMSNHAPGFPHLFVRTTAPVRTPAGEVEAKWVLGGLDQSDYFVRPGLPDTRSLSGFALTLRPAPEPDLVVGVARTVYDLTEGPGGIATRFADVFTRWGGLSATDSVAEFEQILSVFARWLAPLDGFEVYAEWARHELPSSFRDLLVAPEHSQGYTLGLQWLDDLAGDRALRLQAEHTYLEQSPTFRARPIGSYYASRTVQQGYTHRGQVIGAAIGPGASSQWVAVDFLTGESRAGLFAGRIRWANDAYYDKPGGHNRYHAHDVSMLAGARAGFPLLGQRVGLEWTVGKRHNFFFQNPATDWFNRDPVDVVNHTLQVTLTPRGRSQGPPATAAAEPPRALPR